MPGEIEFIIIGYLSTQHIVFLIISAVVALRMNMSKENWMIKEDKHWKRN